MINNKKINVSIIGVLGYTGLELLRILLSHDKVQMKHLVARDCNGDKIGDKIPHLSHLNLYFSSDNIETIAKDSDCVFLALPHGESFQYVEKIANLTRIIDLSADFRLKNETLHKKYYENTPFTQELSNRFQYGFIEKNREVIENAEHIANPGCFAILSQLCILHISKIANFIDIFAITGSSGGGKKLSNGAHHPVRNHNMFSYDINKHRHIGEIIQSFPEIKLNMIPSSGPFSRGIFANCIAKINNNIDDISELLVNKYQFVRYITKVELANIVGSNFCDISITKLDNQTILIQGAIDNLIKGAAGNAVQCMNLMFNFNEEDGLCNINPIFP